MIFFFHRVSYFFSIFFAVEKKSTDNIEKKVSAVNGYETGKLDRWAGVTASARFRHLEAGWRLPSHVKQQHCGLMSGLPVRPVRWDLRFLWKRSRMTFRINETPPPTKNNTNKIPVFSESDSGGVWFHGGSGQGCVFQLSWIVEQKEQHNKPKTLLLSALILVQNKKYKSIFRGSRDSGFRSSSGCSQAAEAESVHVGIRRPTTLSFSSHTFCWSHLRFSVFFFSLTTIQWVLRHFLRKRKEQSIILCNNNKKNYCPLSRKKGKKVSLRISVR